MFAFRQAESANVPIAMIVESKMVGSSDDERNGGDSSVGGTTNSGEAVQLPAGSQHMPQSRRIRDQDLLVLSGSPTYTSEHLYWTTMATCKNKIQS